jgi:cation-transporting ATPase 13A1
MIYCTEPYRIPYAGKLNIICFDKTGTLTKDEMILKGIVAGQDIDIFTGKKKDIGNDDNDTNTREGRNQGEDEEQEEMNEDLISPETTTDFVQIINGTCHDLIERNMNGGGKAEILGDPLEIASFSTSGFQFVPASMVPSSAGGGQQQRRGNNTASFASNHLIHSDLNVMATILHKYPFNSELKRMSTIVQLKSTVASTSNAIPSANSAANKNRSSSSSSSSSSSASSSSDGSHYYVFTKGAPEILSSFLSKIPSSYTEYYQHYMQSGKRVLALAYKKLPNPSSSQFKVLSRSNAEKELHFAGFLIFDCDLKADSRSVIKDLIFSKHQVIMITGDSVYTAANVGKRVSLFETNKIPLILTLVDGKESGEQSLVWRRVDSSDGDNVKKQPGDVNFDGSTTSLSSLCTNDNAVLCLSGSSYEYLLSSPSPSSDETSSSLLKILFPFLTIFARVSPIQKEKILQCYNEIQNYTLMCGDGTNDVGALKAAHVGVSVINNPKLESKVEDVSKGTNKKGKLGTSSKDRMARALLELQEHEADPTIVKLGDASIASPFTAKRTSIDSVLTVIRQGRCTLVGTIQVYKVLALNCLSSAFMMSILYMKGLKQGDTQMTCSGLLIAALFFFVSQAKPLNHISAERPPSTVFQKSVSFSIIGQFLIHLTCMYLTLTLCETTLNSENVTLIPDGKFIPNLFNSAMFLLSNHMQINNFWINYRGPPFMEDITLNIYLWRSLQVIYIALLIIIGGQFEPINDFLQLIPFPSKQFQIQFLIILIFNSGGNYLIERICRKFE